MRPRDPRRLLPSMRRRAAPLATVEVLETPGGTANPDGSVTSRQVAEVTLPANELERIWDAEHLERLARTYWRFLTRVSLGLLRVLYEPGSRRIVLLASPLTLLRFFGPEYETHADRGSVTWRIDRGLLVASRGRGRGLLRISVERIGPEPGGRERLRVASEVSSFYPTIAMRGRLARIGAVVYRATQLRIHVIVTNAFLRSLSRLDLQPSRVGSITGALQRGEPPTANRPGRR